MNNDKINKLGEGPLNEAKLLQPLREVGSHKKLNIGHLRILRMQ